MPNPKNSPFIERICKLPHFDFAQEVEGLRNRLGDGPQLLQAIVDEKYLSKDEACHHWATILNVAYVDPFASVITEEAIEKIPTEVAKKVKSIGLYVLNGVLTVATASPADAA